LTAASRILVRWLAPEKVTQSSVTRCVICERICLDNPPAGCRPDLRPFSCGAAIGRCAMLCGPSPVHSSRSSAGCNDSFHRPDPRREHDPAGTLHPERR
jgi:hypothetical protein